jgi:hypothetical protein
MIASFHRLTCFWLEADPGESWAAPRDFLIGIRSSKVSSSLTQGHISEHYDPERLPSDAPGYIWLRERLHELAAEVPTDADDAPFDAQPAFDPEHPVQERDPFPAFFWRMKLQDSVPWGILEVLVGRDFVVFHQCAMGEARPGEGASALHRLKETGWVNRHASFAALFTAEFTQVSHLETVDFSLWSNEIARFELRSPSAFAFTRDATEFQIRLGIRQASKDGRDIYDGLVLVEQASSDTENGIAPGRLHLEATGFVTRLTTLLCNASKVAWEDGQSEIKYKEIGRSFKADLAELDQFQKQRARVLPAPLSRSGVGRLRSIYYAARKNLEEVNQLVETCRLNMRQFEDISSEFLHAREPWARETLLKHRGLFDDLQARRRTLETQGQWLQEEIHLLLATGGSFAGDSVPEVLQFPGTREAGSCQVPAGLSPLIMIVGSGEEDRPGPSTAWLTGRKEQAGDRDDSPIPLVLRPSEISLDQREDLIGLYVEALADCSPDDLRQLMTLLCSREGILHLASDKIGRTLPVRIGWIFTAGTNPEFQQAEGALLGFLDKSFSKTYSETSSARKNQNWVGMICLLLFIEGVIRFLTKPPAHLASVVREYLAQKPRLLFLMGFLHLVSGQSDEAKGYLRQAAHSALADRDSPWSHFVAQFFRKYEETRASLSEQAVQIWRDQLALEYLKVYDLDSAVGLARAPTLKGSKPALRGVLWVVALAIGSALLLADWLVGPSPPPWFAQLQGQWREFVILSVSALAVLGAPLALWLRARGAMKNLFPDILFPRILGAITLAAIALCASSETERLVVSKFPILCMIIVVSLVGGLGYLYSEVRKKVSSGAEARRRCIDVFSLAFLEATCLSTGFVLIYEGMFEAAFRPTPLVKPSYYVYGVFLRPLNVLLIAILSMFVGIVVQLMTQFSDKRIEDELG